MAKDVSSHDLGSRVSAALLDTLTGLSCIAYWVGVWGMLDSVHVSPWISGLMAFGAVVVLARTAADQWLEKRSKDWNPVARGLVIWCWTCCLVTLSLMIWRLCMWSVDEKVFAQKQLDMEAKLAKTAGDDFQKERARMAKTLGIPWMPVQSYGYPGRTDMTGAHATLMTVLGSCILIAVGRFRSASHAAPIGIVADLCVEGRCFDKAVFSGSELQEVLLDFFLLLPVVFVWRGVWAWYDCLELPALASAIVANLAVAACAICDIDMRLQHAFEGCSKLVKDTADVAYTSVLVLLVVCIWRGLWESLDDRLHLIEHQDIAAGLALAGAVGLTCLHRHRSAVFPPVNFCVDDSQHFAKVGLTCAESVMREHPVAATQPTQYNTV
eukprot:TRINITY_DN107860_c0_g1_i1.p1 TRINITY_DN107860_c0_g1~~TRINITY_DN107860_c0_g1_i1.p1  ORF type:complete len:409 (+),score=54.03 TRINITY_DN107860_c0_g1_i1:82-1227(+)